MSAEILGQFQCEKNRIIEESFACMFANNNDIRLFFLNENNSYTDGKNIVIDPACFDIYDDYECLRFFEIYFSLPHFFSYSRWNALKMVSRALTIHECLHILYSNFPGNQFKDPDFFETEGKTHKNELKVISSISNIIEDAYVEAAGISVYDNIGIYLTFIRFAISGSEKRRESEKKSMFEIVKSDGSAFYGVENTDGHLLEIQKKAQILTDYLNYMVDFLLYPLNFTAPSPEIAEYVEKTKQLFLDGSAQSNPDDRYKYCKQIFEIIKPLIPKDNEAKSNDSLLSQKATGQETHGASIGGEERKGRSQEITKRLFRNLDGTGETYHLGGKDVKKLIERLVLAFEKEEYCVKGYEVSKCGYGIKKRVNVRYSAGYSGNRVGATPVHKNIKINENYLKVNPALRQDYQNIYNEYRLSINSYNSRFLQLLRVHVLVKENKFLFGAGIDSQKMGDFKKRIWFRNTCGNEIPDMSVLLLIDGSGSMDGERRNSAMCSSVILHEVLKTQGIQHAIVEHRAHGIDPEIDVNIMVDFNAKADDKLNLLQLDATGDNRDGLALYWAERYINKKTYCDNKLIIILSDGLPSHSYDCYYGKEAMKDTAKAAKKIISRGTNIIAVALDDECDDDDSDYSTYKNLKKIYPHFHLVQCKDLNRLTGQILQIVSKQLI